MTNVGGRTTFAIPSGGDDRFRPEMHARTSAGGKAPPGLRDGGGFRGRGLWRPNDRMQAVMVKVRYLNGMGGAVKHARYVGKEGKALDGGKPDFFDKDREGIDGVAEVRRWIAEGDGRWWKMPISPEKELDGPAAYMAMVRHTMAQAEADLGTPLTWVAGGHHDGGKVHVHVMVRGRDDQGNDLTIHPDYVKAGFRTRAREFVTYDDRHGLGERSDAEILRARARAQEIRDRRDEGRRLLREAVESGLVSGREARQLGKLVDKGSAQQVEVVAGIVGDRLRDGVERNRDRARSAPSMDMGY